jgi:hypothetical protein
MRTRPTAAGLGLVVLAASSAPALMLACASSAGTSTGTGTAGGTGATTFVPSDAQPEATPVPTNCVPPGTPSNANGVGGYCSPGGGECAGGGPDGAVSICTADTNAPNNAWFCTILCDTTANCGPGGATCLSAIQGQACIPPACAALLGDTPPSDGGSDGGDADGASTDSDAPSDAPPEAGPDANADGPEDGG